MSEPETGRYSRLAAIAGAVVAADQVTKAIILAAVERYEIIPVIPGYFNITHIRNPGGAFGLLADGGWLLRRAVFVAVSSLAAILVLYFYRRTPPTHPWLRAGFALIFGGAIGNLIDRIRFGEVIDFLDVYAGRFHWPAFNVADSAITVGVTIFAVHLLFNKMPD